MFIFMLKHGVLLVGYACVDCSGLGGDLSLTSSTVRDVRDVYRMTRGGDMIVALVRIESSL